MSRDPFDELKRYNPVTPDQLPGAPMAMADRILSRRVRHARPGWVMATAAAVSVAAVGFGLFWFLGEPSSRGVADGGTTTSAGATTTSNPVATTTTVADLDVAGTVYFFVDTTGESWPGPFLMPVARTVDGGDEITGTLQALLDGPTVDEAASVPAISSAVPGSTGINDVTVSGGIATVDLSAEFGSGGGTLSMTGRLGQVVYTLTSLDGIDGVRFEIEGIPTTVFGGEGVIIPDPATRADFEGLLPAVLIESPAYGEFITETPLIARGTANVFEATVSVALTDGEGLIIWEGFTTATCGTGCRGEWEVTIPFEVDELQLGSLIVWESSARDGSQTNVREHPVWLPATTIDNGPTTTVTMPVSCSGTDAATELADQPELPAAVAAKREAIFAAAGSCDWLGLQSLLAGGFSHTFGIDADPIAYWQEREAAGEQVMYLLAELLNRPFGYLEYDKDLSQYVWPSAHGVTWADVPEADREALRPLYGDDDLAGFAEFGGYLGYRIGILADGTWVFYIAGD